MMFKFEYNNRLLNFNNFTFKYLIKKSTTVYIFLGDILRKERKVFKVIIVLVAMVIEGILGVYVFLKLVLLVFLHLIGIGHLLLVASIEK